MNSLYIKNSQLPGDILMLTAAVRDLKAACPSLAIGVGTSCMDLWENNPNIDRKVTESNADRVIDAKYPLYKESNRLPYHFIHAFRMFLEDELDMRIPQGPFCVDIHLTDEEKDPGWVRKVVGISEGYWLVNAGCKSDFTNKLWDVDRYQQVVSRTAGDITWVQTGAFEHTHRPLENVVNLVGRTSIRKMCRLMYHAEGVLTGVSFPMHLSTMESPGHRHCVVVAGGREPPSWEMYPTHQFFHTCGMLPCCVNGGCWKARIVKLNDGSPLDERLCRYPIKRGEKVTPKCMDIITADEVVEAVMRCHKGMQYIKSR